MNDIFFHVAPGEGGKLDIIQLPNKYCNNSVNFTFESKLKQEIHIGRDKTCDIILSWEKTYSKHQASIVWDEFLEQWKVVDGSSKGPSRNGTWVYISKSFEVYDGCIFRIDNSKIKINLTHPHNLAGQES